MSGKEVSLIGEVHVSTGSVYTTVDALEALKCIGMTYGLYGVFMEEKMRLEELLANSVLFEEDNKNDSI